MSKIAIYPPGASNNMLLDENFHFVGTTKRKSATSAIAPSSEQTPTGRSNAKTKETFDVDADADENSQDPRTDRRLNWTKDEDIRLASAWLRNSKDPVDGTDRKADQYWEDVTKEYNQTTESCRQRNRNQLKIRWDRVKKPVSEYHGCWIQTSRVYRSGFSDDQLMDLADKMYASTHNNKDFMLKHIWKVVRDERKWSAYVKRMEKEKEKEKEKGATTKPVEVVNLDDNPNMRPMGHKKAKDERYGKKKASDAYSAISEKLDKFIEVSTMARKDREKVSEVQQNLANSKLEAAKLAHKAAQEQVKCKMLDTYKDLLLAPTSNLSAHALAEREKALESMRMVLFATDN
nr:glutathione S-transferase T3-like [Setaria viridis]